MIDINELPAETIRRASKVRMILMDADGVLTAGMMVYDCQGQELKHFHAHDGLGIKLARLGGLKTGIVSAGLSHAIRVRARRLKMDYCHLACEKKLAMMKRTAEDAGVSLEECCFIGDDLPDVPALREAGLAVAVRNAVDTVKESAHYVTMLSGGQGAVREVIELVLRARGVYDAVVDALWAEASDKTAPSDQGSLETIT